MRKYSAIIFSIFLGLVVTSCLEEAEVWDSSVKDISGNWYVDYTMQGTSASGGYVPSLTFNTADDNGEEMWLTDIMNGTANFWEYRVKVPVNTTDKTFGSEDTLICDVDGYDIKMIVRNGKVTLDAVTLPSGYVSDSIYYEIWFEDQSGSFPANEFFEVSGYRKSGFEEDEP